MRIEKIYPQPDYTLEIVANDGRTGVFDVTPYLHDEAFMALQDQGVFMRVS